MHCTSGFFYQGALGCICSQEGYCKCVRHDFDPNNNSSNSMNNINSTVNNGPTLRTRMTTDSEMRLSALDLMRIVDDTRNDAMRTQDSKNSDPTRRRTMQGNFVASRASLNVSNVLNSNPRNSIITTETNNSANNKNINSHIVAKQLQFCKFELANLISPPHLEIDFGSFIR